LVLGGVDKKRQYLAKDKHRLGTPFLRFWIFLAPLWPYTLFAHHTHAAFAAAALIIAMRRRAPAPSTRLRKSATPLGISLSAASNVVKTCAAGIAYVRIWRHCSAKYGTLGLKKHRANNKQHQTQWHFPYSDARQAP